MRKAQRIVLIAGTVLLALAILFPPWLVIFHTSEVSNKRSIGYHLIFTPPTVEEWVSEKAFQLRSSCEIDKTRLEFEILGVLLITSLVFFALRKRTA